MGFKKKLKCYIKDDRPLRLQSYVSSHKISLRYVKLRNGQNLLHYCAKNGSAEMLRCLLCLECDPSTQDKDGNLPLHLALHRGLEGNHTIAREALLEIVNPLLGAFPLGQDVENKEGATGFDLLASLKKKVKNISLSAEEIEREKDRIKEEEDDMWRNKLSEEAMFEFEEQFPRYSFKEDYTQERTYESYDEWSDSIRQEYAKKHHKTSHHTFQRDRKRKFEERHEREGRNTKSDDKRREEEKLKEAREEMRKRFKPDLVENGADRLLAKKRRYESKFAHLVGHLPGQTLTFACIPWPSPDLNAVADILFCDFPDKKSEAYRKYLRAQQVRWHPDKFTQKFKDYLHPDHVTKIMSRAKAISQILNHISSSDKNMS